MMDNRDLNLQNVITALNNLPELAPPSGLREKSVALACQLGPRRRFALREFCAGIAMTAAVALLVFVTFPIFETNRAQNVQNDWVSPQALGGEPWEVLPEAGPAFGFRLADDELYLGYSIDPWDYDMADDGPPPVADAPLVMAAPPLDRDFERQTLASNHFIRIGVEDMEVAQFAAINLGGEVRFMQPDFAQVRIQIAFEQAEEAVRAVNVLRAFGEVTEYVYYSDFIEDAANSVTIFLFDRP